MELLRKFLKIIFPESRTLSSAYLGLTVKTVKILQIRMTHENDTILLIIMLSRNILFSNFSLCVVGLEVSTFFIL